MSDERERKKVRSKHYHFATDHLASSRSGYIMHSFLVNADKNDNFTDYLP